MTDAGGRVSVQSSAGRGQAAMEQTIDYSCDPLNRLSKTTEAGTETYTYNANNEVKGRERLENQHLSPPCAIRLVVALPLASQIDEDGKVYKLTPCVGG